LIADGDATVQSFVCLVFARRKKRTANPGFTSFFFRSWNTRL
jgi:hypothetical protein